MKPRDDDDPSRLSPDVDFADVLAGFFQRHPRFFIYLGIVFAALIAGALVVMLTVK